MEEILHQLIFKISRSLGRILYIPGGFLARFLNHQLHHPNVQLFRLKESRVQSGNFAQHLKSLGGALWPHRNFTRFFVYFQRFSQSRRKICVKV